MFWTMLKSIAARRVVRGLLVGVGGGVLTAVGWKIGVDVYEAIKKKLSEKRAESESSVETPAAER